MPPRSRPRVSCLAVCLPGLEALLAGELRGLGIRTTTPARGGVPFEATTRQLYASNLWLRSATRVLVRVARFEARDLPTLEARADELPWGDWLGPGVRPELRVSSSGSKLYHTGAVAERLGRAAVRAGTLPPAPASASASASAGTAIDVAPDPTQLLVVRVTHDRVTISLDSSGEPLHRRGWRGPLARAPLRPTLAAALLAAAGWDGSTPLVDPFCGSGTIAIEAARLAAGLPAVTVRGLAGSEAAGDAARTFAFTRWPIFEPGTWASVRADVRPPAPPSQPIVASDRDDGAVAATIDNAIRAGVAEHLLVRRATVSELSPPPGVDEPGWVITNPPFGGRVGGGDLRNLYARTGQVLRDCFGGWQVLMLSADPGLTRHAGLRWTELFRTTTGGIPVGALAARVPGRPPAS